MSDNAPIVSETPPPPDYRWKPEFVAKPAEDAIEIDATQATLVTDLTNSLGENFHFEIEPESAPVTVAPRTGNIAFGDKVYVELHFPTGLTTG